MGEAMEQARSLAPVQVCIACDSGDGGIVTHPVDVAWLIAVAILQRGRGICEYRNIELPSRRGHAPDQIGP